MAGIGRPFSFSLVVLVLVDTLPSFSRVEYAMASHRQFHIHHAAIVRHCQPVMMVATLVASCLGGRGHSGRIVHTNHRHPGGRDCSRKHQNTHK